MGLREKIADIVGQYDDQGWSDEVTGAILATIREDIPPLEWDKHPDEQEWYAKLPETDHIERGYMILPCGSGFNLFDGFAHRKRKMGYFTLSGEAQEFASAHHVSSLLRAMGMEGEG